MIYVPSIHLDCSRGLRQLYRLKRSQLNLIATRLGETNPLKYINKTELSNHISNISKQPSVRCYNKEDPFNLEDIDSIDSKYLIEWNQYQRHFGANICNLKYMFENDIYTLPWAIDFASGLDKSSNIEEYNYNFDMRNVKDLYELVLNYDTISIQKNTNTFSFIFEVDNLLKCENYSYGYIINNILNNTVCNIYALMSSAMHLMNDHLYGHNHPYKDVFHQYVYLNYCTQGYLITDKNEHLRFIIYVFKNLEEVIGGNASIILNIMFIEMENKINNI
jgi:hypothetical protein